jgi:hypothetical protein
VYPGQDIHGSVFLPQYGNDVQVTLYAHDVETGKIIAGEAKQLKKGEWLELSLHIPAMEGALIDEAGFAFTMLGLQHMPQDLTCLIDDLYFDGRPDYSVDLSKAKEDAWNGLHREIIQFGKLKGLWYLEDGYAHLSCGDFGEAYTGHHNWRDYTAAFTLKPLTGEDHYVNVRVQGAIRSYAAGFAPNGKLVFSKNENGYKVLAEADFAWQPDKDYCITVIAKGADFKVAVDGKEYLSISDKNNPYLNGAVGFSVRKGSHCAYKLIQIN